MRMHRRVLVISHFSAYLLFAQNLPHDRFIIASFYDPWMTGVPATDEASLVRLRDAHFNTLTGANDHQHEDPQDHCSVVPGGNVQPGGCNTFIRYKLERVANVGGLKLIVSDERMYPLPSQALRGYDPGVRDEIIRDWGPNAASPDPLLRSTLQPFTPAMRNSVFGYNLPDEPGEGDNTALTRINQWVDGLRAADPTRAGYWNLAPLLNHVSPFNSNPDAALISRFQTYVRSYAQGNSNPFILFDFYPFLVGGTRGGYYLSHQIMAEESRTANKFYWATVSSVNSRRRLADCSVDPVNNYAPLTAISVRKQAYIPIIYGAKGITWFLYRNPPAEGCPGWVYDPGMSNVGSPIYDWVRNVNLTLKNMGPTLLRARWLTTVHGNSLDPFASPNEHNLPTINGSTPVISGSIPNAFAIGIFAHNGRTMRNSLAILNKDPVNANTITVTLKKPAVIYRHAKQADRWVRVSGRTNTFTLTIQPADLELIGLGPLDLVSTVVRRNK